MRLTYKYEKIIGYGSVKLKNLPPDPLIDRISYLDNAWEEQRNKLGQLEDIEEELGIDLITLFKALKDMIYVKDDNEIKKAYPTLSHIKNEGYVFDVLCARIVKLCDYGKTWSLNKEDLIRQI